ncbi:hypothetical protein [Thiomicrorhabdus cannonii]|uniref:hypothetical protein n=1 Tax=Thiomicrorhabdus cannonii TaxID=2748011 RepID=UPI0015C14604|nr:hypothetical protein [Thiomicrorhabdus cannonii]
MSIKVGNLPKFDAVEIMRQAVAREVRRKKALGQYIVVAERGVPRKVDFSVLPVRSKKLDICIEHCEKELK